MWPQQPGVKSSGLHRLQGLHEQVYHGRKFDRSGADCHSASLITASVNGDVVCSVRGRHIQQVFSLTVLAVKSSLLQTYFLDYITTFS